MQTMQRAGHRYPALPPVLAGRCGVALTGLGPPFLRACRCLLHPVASYNAASAIIAAAKRSGKASPKAADIQAQFTNKAFQFKSWGNVWARFNTYGDLVRPLCPTLVYSYDHKGATALLMDK